MTESIPLKSPLEGLQMTSETAQYVGMLEGTIAALVVNEMKYRTLLELLTGEEWDGGTLDSDPESLVPLAVSALVRQTSLDENKAKSLVLKRMGKRRNSVVPQSIRKVGPTPANMPRMNDRFKSWKSRQESASSEI